MQHEQHDEEAPHNEDDQHFEEKIYVPGAGGWKALLLLGTLLLIIGGICIGTGASAGLVALIPLGAICCFVGFLACCCTCQGITCIDPNQAVFLTYCAKYIGTLKQNGIFWTNPLYTKAKMSLQISNFETTQSKVNDKNGTPIVIQCVIVWKVRDTAKATYAVSNYYHFLSTQAESAMRICAALYPYETEDENTPSLRGSPEIVSAALRRAVQDRVDKCGVEIVEAKISHLAYAQEIAASMLKKQQAQAVIAAKKEIVSGAVGMVKMALDAIEEQQIAKLTDEHKA